MPHSCPVKQREAQRAYQSRKRRKTRLWVRDYKDRKPCTDCGVEYPYYVMQFDHLSDKVGNISDMVSSGHLSAVKREVEKCELVCANCHAERTHQRSTGGTGIHISFRN